MNTRVGTILSFCVMSIAPAFGQATNSADVTGTVTDSTGAVVPGVAVTIKDIDKGLERGYHDERIGTLRFGTGCPG